MKFIKILILVGIISILINIWICSIQPITKIAVVDDFVVFYRD